MRTVLFIAHDVNVYRKGFDLVVNAIKGIRDIKFNLISVGGDKVAVDEDINHIHYNRIHNSDEFKSFPDTEMDKFVQANTNFSSWQDMLGAAGAESYKKQLGL